MNVRLTVALLFAAVLIFVAPASKANSVAPTRKNSSYGQGTGGGSWNLASTSLNVNGATVEEQTICPGGDGFGADCISSGSSFVYAFLIQSSLTNFDFTLSNLSDFTLDPSSPTFGVLVCDTSLSGVNLPGPICTDPSNSVISGISYTNNGNSSVTFDVNGQGNLLTFFVNENGSSTPQASISSFAVTPEPSSMLLLSAGLFGVWWKRRLRH